MWPSRKLWSLRSNSLKRCQLCAGAAYWLHCRSQKKADSSRDYLVPSALSLRTSRDLDSMQGAQNQSPRLEAVSKSRQSAH